MVSHTAVVSFSRGEITPLAQARRDIEMYRAAAKSLSNFLVMKEGGIRRRSGTRYRGAAKFANKDTRLIDFVFSSSQAYALEMGDSYTRFWINGAQIVSGPDPYELVSPFAEADLRHLHWAQSFDTLFFSRQSMTIKPKKLIRHSHTSWEWQDIDFWDGPYLPINDENNAVAISTSPIPGANVTFTFTNLLGLNGGAGLQSTDVGRHFRIQAGGSWSWGNITSVSSNKIMAVHIEDGEATGTTSSKSWRFGAFSDTTGYPGAIAWFQGRLFLAGTPDNPRGIWFSRSEFPEDFTPSDYDGTVADDHGGYLTTIGKADGILWMQEAPRLQIATSGAIRSLGSTVSTSAFGPRNVSQQIEVNGGVSPVDPVLIGPSTVHATRFGKGIEDLYFDFNANALVTPRITNLSEHMFDSGVLELWYQQEPNFTLWSLLADGTLAATTIDRYEKVIGFSRHSLAGGQIISCCTIPGTAQDDFYMVVRRTINGSQVQYIETLEPRFLRMAKADAWFVDCGGQYSGAATNTVSSITWLANEEVDILADGAVVKRQTVSGAGVLTLPNGMTATKITFGIPIVAEGELLEAPIDTPEGSSKGRKMRVVEVVADVYETLGLKFVSDKGVIDSVFHRAPGTPMGASSALVSGSRKIPIDGSWNSKGSFGFVCDQPLPCTIRAFNIGLDYEP